MKKCIYCKNQILDERLIDVCNHCGIGVWGEKMFNAIIQNMENEKEKGNMELGRVSESGPSNKTPTIEGLKESKETRGNLETLHNQNLLGESVEFDLEDNLKQGFSSPEESNLEVLEFRRDSF